MTARDAARLRDLIARAALAAGQPSPLVTPADRWDIGTPPGPLSDRRRYGREIGDPTGAMTRAAEYAQPE